MVAPIILLLIVDRIEIQLSIHRSCRRRSCQTCRWWHIDQMIGRLCGDGGQQGFERHSLVWRSTSNLIVYYIIKKQKLIKEHRITNLKSGGYDKIKGYSCYNPCKVEKREQKRNTWENCKSLRVHVLYCGRAYLLHVLETVIIILTSSDMARRGMHTSPKTIPYQECH